MAERVPNNNLQLAPCCCFLLNIEYKILGEEFVVQLLLEPQYDESGQCYYDIQLPVPSFSIDLVLSWGTIKKEDEGWAISLDGEDVYVFESDYVCPISTLENWEYVGGGISELEITSLYISPIECTNPEIDVPVIQVPDPNCDEPFSCKFVNLLKKQKAALALDIAANRNHEMFGLKGCADNWNNLFMRSLIIDALQCVPYGVYSEATENCLINKLTENCNC